MNSFKCKECGAEFDGRRNLHAHLKAHKITVEEYYRKHFPRFDLYSHKPIKFKNVDQYLTTDFNRPSNLKRWMQKEPELVVKPYLKDLMRLKIEERTQFVMGQVQLLSYDLPSVNEIENLFGSYEAFCKEVGYPAQFPDEIPPEFKECYSGKTILVDTREKKPLKFKYTETFTLDFGDYTLPARNFTYTFVDRKSVEDFVSTLGLDFDRVDREIQRCRDAGCYIFFVIDGHMSSIKDYITFNKWNLSSTHAHVMHNMRELLRKHAGHCQFVFSGGRKKSQEIIPKLLFCGKKVWNVDIQNYLDNVDSR